MEGSMDELPSELEEFLFWENQLDKGFSEIIEAPNEATSKDADEMFVNLLYKVKSKGMDELYDDYYGQYVALLRGDFDEGYVKGQRDFKEDKHHHDEDKDYDDGNGVYFSK